MMWSFKQSVRVLVCAFSASFGASWAQTIPPGLNDQAAFQSVLTASGLSVPNAGSKPRQMSPVSQPQKQTAHSLAPIQGFQESAQSLRPFGENLFATGVAPFSLVSDMPVPLDYVVGIGDVVEVRYFGKENRQLNLTVDRSGSIVIPDVGPVSVAGQTFGAVGRSVLERIAKHKIGVEATVNMGPLRSIQVNLVGEVHNPGAYATDALTTVVNALLVAGGVKPTGSMRKIEIRRAGAVVARIDLYDVILKGADKAALRLQSGDVIFVPGVGKRVALSGDVLRPAIYELSTERTVEDVLSLAGGALPTGYLSQVKLDRVGTSGARQLLDLPLSLSGNLMFGVRDGDVLHIPSVFARWDRAVTISGAVRAPGAHEWKEGLSLADVLRGTDDLARDAYRPMAIIETTDPLSGARKFRSINLIDVLSGKVRQPLMPLDRIYVLSAADVEFLSGAAVQSVLIGELPPEKSGKRAGLVNMGQAQDEGLGAKSPASLVDDRRGQNSAGPAMRQKSVVYFDEAEGNSSSPIPLDRERDANNEPLDPAKQSLVLTKKRSTKEGQQDCQGLVDLADIVSREGGERFRAAMLPASSGRNVVLLKNVPCTPLFNEKASLLPYLLEQSVSVRGEVQQPGVLPIPEGFPLELALAVRGGLTRESDRSGVELSQNSGSSSAKQQVLRQVVKASMLAQTELSPGDMVLVKKRFSDLLPGVVRLGGEFVHPGAYEIKRGERLSELIARAGGMTQEAYTLGSVFLRKSVKEEKKQFYQRSALELQNGLLFSISRQRAAGAATAGGEQLVLKLVEEMRNIDPVGRMVVEADPAVLLVRPELDLVLEPGDEIYVPRRPSSILVMGEVLNPGAVQFQSGKKASDYIAAAGGMSGLADEDKVFAILPNGTAEPVKLSAWNFSEKRLPPGSTIYVSRNVAPMLPVDILTLSLTLLKDLALSAASLSVISK